MTTDNRTNEPTDEQVEAAAKVLFTIEEPDLNDWRWNRENPYAPNNPHGWRKYWLDAARAALVAACAYSVIFTMNAISWTRSHKIKKELSVRS